jgi:hypothetical protein
MKQIDPIISVIAMAAVAVVIGLMSTYFIGIVTFAGLYVTGLLGDKIMGNIPNSHD